jgi:predicted HicB family RNase H-like nuclease
MKHINLRVPDDIHEQLVAAAETDDRSLNREILWLLRAALAAR